jgi:O-acetyl-ADP-ribose deacetylase (regulator of RNase III)
MRENKSIIDTAKNYNNRLRKDQPIQLIDKNEKETKLLLNGFYSIPKFNRVDILNKVKLTNQFVLDLNDDAIVNTANEALMGGGGMDLLIHSYAGPSLKLETEQLPNVIEGNYYYGVKCLTGDAKITSGHNLNSKYIIHAVTPYLDSNDNTDKRAHVDSYKSILKYIDGKNIRNITIGPISTGYYGYPMLEATVLGLLVIRKYLEENYNLVDKINLWIYNQTQYKIYEYLIPQIL